MNSIRFLPAPIAALAAILVAGSSAPAQQPQKDPLGHVMLRPDEVKWEPGPASLPAGAQLAVLEGDLTKPVPYTFRLKFPAGYQIPPHWHPVTEHITVIEGKLMMGLGDRFTRTGAMELPAGSLFILPVGQRHFAWTEGETIVQLHGVGPWGIIYVNPADDPRNGGSRRTAE